MHNWTIGKRITLGGSILIALLLVVSTVAISSLRRLESFATANLRDDSIPGMVYASQMAEYSLRSHIRTLMAANTTDLVKREQFLAQMEENVAKVSVAFTNYSASITQDEDRRMFADITQKRANYRAVRVEYLELVKAGKAAEADTFAVEKMDPVFTAYRDSMNDMLEWNQRVAVKVTENMIRTARNSTIFAAIFSGVSVLVAIVIGWTIIRGTNKVLTSVATALNVGANQVASAAHQVSSSSQTLAEGASEQASSLEETSSSLEEMSSMTKRNAESAKQANDLGKQARDAADKGAVDMKTMGSAMEAIKVSSDDIAKIIKTIDEIAFQTNILALNAAVEAARAGEAGMGFAVVADEVRNLAQRCAQAAKETSGKIEGAIAKTGQGVEISSKVAQTLNEIVTKVRQVDELVTEVANASREQTDGIGQVNSAVGQMDQVTQNTAATAEESAAAAEELSAQAEIMTRSVAELLQLVGGQVKANATNSSVDTSGARAKRIAGPMVKRPGLVVGRSLAHAEPVLPGKTGGRHEVHIEDDFKDSQAD